MTKHDDQVISNDKQAGVFRRTVRLINTFIYSVLMMAILLSPMLLIAGAAYWGGRYFERKDSQLSVDGITTTATIVDVTFDHLGSLLQGGTDNALNRSGAQRNDNDYCKIQYRFRTEDGQEIEGSISRVYDSLEDAKSLIGNEFEIVYSAADPSIYETKLGHTESQASAMEIISFVFLGLWGVSAIGAGGWMTLSLAKPKSRKARIKELAKQQKTKRAKDNA